MKALTTSIIIKICDPGRGKSPKDPKLSKSLDALMGICQKHPEGGREYKYINIFREGGETENSKSPTYFVYYSIGLVS